MNFSTIGGGGMSAYVNALLAKVTGDKTADAASTPATAAAKSAAAESLSAAAHSFKSSSAQQKLEHSQATLASDLRAAMSKAGVSVGSGVSFSVGANGELAVEGSDQDKAAVEAFLKADAHKPSFSSRLSSLSSEANALSASIRQNAAISQAARQAGSSANVMAMYSSLLKQQDASPATFAMSASTSSLTYPGMLSSMA